MEISRRVFPGHQHRAHGPQGAEVRRNDEPGLIQAEDFPEGLAHPQVVGHAALKGDGRSEGLALGDIALEVPGHGLAEAGDDLVIRGGALLQVDHVGLGKDAAAPGHPGRGGGFQGQFAEILDAVAQPVRLLVQKRAGPRGAHGVHGEILDNQVAVFLRHHDHLGVFAPHVDDGAGLGRKMVRSPPLGDDFVDEPAAQNLRQALAPHAGAGQQPAVFQGKFQGFQQV